MSKTTKHILVALFIGVGVFVFWEMYKAWRAGVTAIGDIIMAPWTAAKAVWSATSSAASTVAGNVSAASSLPSLTSSETSAAAAQQTVAQSYQPGGDMYNKILASSGKAAADAAAQAALNNANNQSAQAAADSAGYGFANIWQYL